MDSFFGIGLPELVVILIFAGLVMGPQRIRQIARILGRVTAQLQAISREFSRQLNAELDALDGGDDMKGAVHDLKALQREVDELRRELADSGRALTRPAEQARKEAEAALQGDSKVDDKSEVALPEETAVPKPIDVQDDPVS